MSGGIRIEELSEDDLDQTVRFQYEQVAGRGSGSNFHRARVENAHWYLFENPELSGNLPRGFVARSGSGEVIGTMQCSPQRFRVGNREMVLLCSGGYYVDGSHRGVGLRLMRALLDSGEGIIHFASTMNEVSGAIYERYGGYPIPDTEHEMIGVLRWPPVVEEAVGRRIGRPAFARMISWPTALLPSRIGRATIGRLVEIASADELATLRWETPPEHAAQVTAARDPRFLRWRYFGGPDRTRCVFRYVDAADRSAFVATRIERRGSEGQIRSLCVLDYWGALEQDAIQDVARQLARRFAGEADILVFRGQPPGRQEALRRAGFMRRLLPRAIGVCIDLAHRLPSQSWYLVPGDGDTSI